MNSYHLRTREVSRQDGLSMEMFTLDSIFVPEREILVGYVQENRREGFIVSYPCPSEFSESAQKIIEENREVVGEIISQINLPEEIVEEIRKKYGSYPKSK